MPKLKTKSAAKKRFQVKKSGAVKFRRAGSRHLATFGKTPKQKRGLRGTDHLSDSDAKTIKDNFPYAREGERGPNAPAGLSKRSGGSPPGPPPAQQE